MEYYFPNIDDYDKIYSEYPEESEEIIKKLKKDFNLNSKDIKEAEKKLESIPWEKKDITFFLIPKGSPRPRSGRWNNFYVKGASELHRTFSKYLQMEGIICTRTHLSIECYLPTPINQMSPMDILLCEKKYIEPLVSPDYDNLAKTYTDAMQGSLLLNDNIVSLGLIKKFYSVKPRIKISLEYQTDFDCEYNRHKVLISRSYKKFYGEE